MESEKLTGWQPIETAPKDGTEFLALVSNGWYALVSAPADRLRNEWPYLWWRSSDRNSYPVVQTFPADTDWDATSTLRLTHWQPLPAPPGTTRAPADLRSALEAETLLKIIAKIDVQAECLEHYAEQDGHSGKAPASVYHWQATHFRDIAAELRAALAPTKGDVS